ncbi:DUF5685 family protein [Rhodopirellula sp. MGV]|uniref:DUF5685 family protein n=1 Tax=Rhodopirellula sp. MGV TaxID=2023130 RepID=UPI000B963525|nr:DUF5685 family protein [Rhodopirellula sp. MGV]OYP34511.1 hypothetical protein CGZ80_14670 [Rhodopirellula sp. MGV]PNY36906.1 hypothetical protein C2E31_10635 [Rhodopirellula baltica]
MFGFLRGSSCDRRYRQVYATVCSSLRERHGFRLLPFVSYEAVWLHCLAVDLGVVPAPDANTVTCCKAQRRHSPLSNSYSELPGQASQHLGSSGLSVGLNAMLEFDLALTVLLIRTKLDDDVRDRRSIVARALRRLYRRAWQQSEGFFDALDAGFMHRLERILSKHLEQEQSGRAEPRHQVRLQEYCRPTGAAFAEVFQLAPQAIAARMNQSVGPTLADRFKEAGEQIGRALIAFDCAVDYDTDRRRGEFNPLPDRHAIIDALSYSQQQLCQLGFQIDQWVAERGETGAPMSTAVLKTVVGKIGLYKEGFAKSRKQRIADRQRIWLSPPRLQRGICDCDCLCCCCDAGEGACASEGCIGTMHCCPCDPCCGYCMDCERDQSRKKKPNGNVNQGGAANHAQGGQLPTLGRASENFPGHAIARTDLTPYGTIALDQGAGGAQEYPAKTDRGSIEAGSRVRVIGREPFGFLVRLAEENKN